ncbi:SMI1/KNR4 family protein [Longispora sp. K20-0274]|uniref:SMI1/KNR4 family protein n=1 Tax=Longispora sp. K20-0274 TaxID=3088255 RepID=UPI00399AD8BE
MGELTDWKVLLGEMILAKSQLDERDPQHLEPYTLPRGPAAEEDVSGISLPADYRAFLAHADGWPSFYMDADLFGSPELRGGGSADVARELLATYAEAGVFEDMGWAVADVLPIGAGAGMRDLFVIGRVGTTVEGQVSWIDAEEIERYDDLAQFVATMRDATERRARQLGEARPL